MAGSLVSMGNLARIAKIVALLLFLLPWVTVSCSPQALGPAPPPPGATSGAGDMVLAKASGLRLATGTVTPTNPNPSAASAPPNPFSRPNVPILGAALLILLSLAATFVMKGGKGALAAAAGCALAACALGYAVLVQIPEQVRASFLSDARGNAGSPFNPAEITQFIHTRTEAGFWLTLLALAAAAVLNVLAMRGAAPRAEPPGA